jgi:hypothetical protein
VASIGSSQADAFMSGVAHPLNAGRANAGSITLDGGLQSDSDRWAAMSPHGVLASATGGSPADTDAGVEFGQQALGDQADSAMAGQSWDRALMQRAAGIGTDDNAS